MDTNVLLAAYAPKDPMNREARNFLDKNRALKVASPLTFVELSAILGRANPSLDIPTSYTHEYSLRQRIRASVEYMFHDADVRLASHVGISTLRFQQRTISLPMEYSSAAKIAHALGLKTLDLLHLAYAHLISKLQLHIDSFITGDGDILSKASQIQHELGLTVDRPR
ncbi:MAG TPA: PIN domain-containing protein [Candidatus Bathyarchaeia archaeon]|nr:PIN domain-containing protein [Candidatus Bathyarchaeia archaeon]